MAWPASLRVLKRAPIDQFLFEGAPEGLHGGVVIAAGFATHGREGLALRQSVAEISAGVLAAAVGVEDQFGSRLAMSKRHAPGREDQLGVDVLVHGPADDPTAVDIHDAGQVEPALLGGDVGDVPDPDLIGSARGGQIGQAIGGDGLVVVAVGGVDPEPTFGASTEAFLTH